MASGITGSLDAERNKDAEQTQRLIDAHGTGYRADIAGAAGAAGTGYGARKSAVSDIYKSMSERSSALRRAAAAYDPRVVMQGAQAAAAQAQANMSTAMIGANAGRNPLAARQAALDAGRQRASIMAGGRQAAASMGKQANELRAQAAESDQARADGLAAELTPGEIASEEIQMGHATLGTLVPWALDNSILVGHGDQRGPWVELYNAIISGVLPAQNTPEGQKYWGDLARYVYYRQFMDGPAAKGAATMAATSEGQPAL